MVSQRHLPGRRRAPLGAWLLTGVAQLGLILWGASCFPGQRPVADNLECAEGTCVCAAGFDDCDGDPVTGCEASVSSDPSNCGACGVRCNGACAANTCLTDQCEAGYSDCNDDAADGCEAALESDVDNCGACSHPCYEGACGSGHCEPFELVDRGLYAISMVADDGYLYFCEAIAGALLRLPAGGSELETLTSDQRCGWRSWDGLPGLLAAGADHLYWTTGVWAVDGWTYVERLHAGPKQGGSPVVVAPTDLIDLDAAFLALAAEGNHVVWALQSGSGDVLIEAAGAGGSDPLLVSVSAKPVDQLVLSGDTVVWMEPVDPAFEGAPDSLIKRAPVSGTGEPEILVAGFGIAQLTAYQDLLYWTVHDTVAAEHRIMRQPAAGGVPEVVYVAKRPFRAIVPDAAEIYFVEGINGMGVGLYGVSTDGSSLTTFSNSHYVYTVTADAQLVYWADYTDRIFALAK